MRKIFIYTTIMITSVLSLMSAPPLKPVKINVERPREIYVRDAVNHENRPYWVVTYRLENNTGEDRELALRVFIESDVKRLDQEYKRVDCILSKRIEQLVEEKDNRKYLNYIEMSEHPFRRGEVRDGILVFPRPARRADELTVYIDGLSSVQIVEETTENLRKKSRDMMHVVRPEKIFYQKREEERYRHYTDEDFAKAESLSFRERLIYRQTFIRKGDEFHIHEDDIKKLKNELDHWVIVLDPVKSN